MGRRPLKGILFRVPAGVGFVSRRCDGSDAHAAPPRRASFPDSARRVLGSPFGCPRGTIRPSGTCHASLARGTRCGISASAAGARTRPRGSPASARPRATSTRWRTGAAQSRRPPPTARARTPRAIPLQLLVLSSILLFVCRLCLVSLAYDLSGGAFQPLLTFFLGMHPSPVLEPASPAPDGRVPGLTATCIAESWRRFDELAAQRRSVTNVWVSPKPLSLRRGGVYWPQCEKPSGF